MVFSAETRCPEVVRFGKTKGLDHLQDTHSQLRLAAVSREAGGTFGD
jgi:hypothetical protein